MDLGLHSKKKPNPREHANPLSALTFSYMFPTFIKGFKKELQVSDVHETLSEHKSAKLGDKLEANWRKEEERARKGKRKPSLKRAICNTFAPEFMIYGFFIAFTEIIIKTAQPIFLGHLILYFMPSDNPMTQRDAYLYATGIIVCSLLTILITHPTVMGTFHLGMKLRVACCSLIYRKGLRLNKTALGQTTCGQVVNLLSNDVSRFDICANFAHYMWIAPIQTGVITFLMYEEVGLSVAAGLIFLLMFIPLQFFLAQKIAKYRLRTALRTDERVRLMNEIISGIQVIKMYTWEKPFENLVALARRFEIQSIRSTSYIKAIYMSFIIFLTRVALFLTIITYLLQDYNITAKQVFVLTAFYNLLRHTMTIYFAQGVAQIAEANVSINRLNKFMLYNENELETKLEHPILLKDGEKKDVHLNNNTFDDGNAITIKNGTAKWGGEGSNENTIDRFNLKIKRGSLVAVIGPVGSGKSSLLHVLLKELSLKEGSLRVNGKISYASQEPWLFAGSVQQNILFGQEMNKLHFRTVVKKCALERDFHLLPFAEKTIVGERGVSLSGGQRARINLARAIYKEADIYLLDDPLSAVDTHVGKELFHDCIQNYLRDKTVILITHQLQYLKDVDHIIILEDGQIKAEGTFSQLQKSGLDFAKLLDRESEQKEDKHKEASPRVSLQKQTSMISIVSVESVNEPQVVDEQRSEGSVSGTIYKTYARAGANMCVIFLVAASFLLTQVISSVGDYFISFWMNLEQARNPKSKMPEDSFWNLSKETCMYIYTGLIIFTVAVTLSRSLAFFVVCTKASTKLHNRMFGSIANATMRFFNTNTSGRILNRFSKDIGSIDDVLPLTMMDCLQIGLLLLGIIIVVAVVNPWLMIPTALIGIIFYFLRIFYLRTSRSVKRLEGITRSPVFAHLNASLQGLTTIRAFGAEKILEKEFDNLQDLHSSVWFSFLATSRAFGLWLDLFCVLYIALVTLSFLFLDNETYGGNVGLAITQAIGLTGMFQWGMRQSAELENQMTSVERVLEYSKVEHERELESAPEKKPPSTWPDKGEIKFVNLFLNYFPSDPPVLKNLNVLIRPLEKVGIVGRTGAGKSSLISALFQLTDTKGSILIDNVDIQDLGLHDLRSKISIIPQEPVLFSGTMRKNLDPFDEYDDEVLWKVLEQVELKEAVNDLTSGLNSKMSEGGSNFSVGQRQLVCLARAIIRNNKILVLDEATANVDPQTDSLIQHTIRNKFADCTVLTIAHRLNTVMDSDKVLVMDAGEMVQFGHPHELLKNENGVFYCMVQQTGKVMAETLSKIAEDSYEECGRRART